MSPQTKNTVKVVIDGKDIEVPRGTTILDAARQLGIAIPTLCHSSLVEPYAACRVCSVVTGRPRRAGEPTVRRRGRQVARPVHEARGPA